jgi:hypothetical protein
MTDSFRNACFVALAVSLMACGDTSAPPKADTSTDTHTPAPPDTQPTIVELVLHFCSDDVPVFMAVQNDGAAWTRVRSTGTSFVVPTARKFGLLLVRGRETEVLYVSRHELAPINDVRCDEPPSRIVRGTVTGLGGKEAAISLFVTNGFANAQFTGFAYSAPSRPVDLNRAHGATSVFPRTEADAFVASFHSAGGTHHGLLTAPAVSGGPVRLPVIPASLTKEGDVYTIHYQSTNFEEPFGRASNSGVSRTGFS